MSLIAELHRCMKFDQNLKHGVLSGTLIDRSKKYVNKKYMHTYLKAEYFDLLDQQKYFYY